MTFQALCVDTYRNVETATREIWLFEHWNKLFRKPLLKCLFKSLNFF